MPLSGFYFSIAGGPVHRQARHRLAVRQQGLREAGAAARRVNGGPDAIVGGCYTYALIMTDIAI